MVIDREKELQKITWDTFTKYKRLMGEFDKPLTAQDEKIFQLFLESAVKGLNLESMAVILNKELEPEGAKNAH